MFKCDVCGKEFYVDRLDRQWAGLVCHRCSVQMQRGIHPDQIRKQNSGGKI